VRTFGKGPALLLIHGFPVHGYTWRKLLPALAQRFTCFVVDLPGLGASAWTPATDFTFTAQARRLGVLTKQLGLEHHGLVAHDTGATVARLLALEQPSRVTRLALFNTEIPGHRPPWIRFHQRTSVLPGAGATFRLLLGLRWFARSPMALGEFYSDATIFDEPGRLDPYLAPVVASPERMDGMLRYLRGIEWNVVDGLREAHRRIQAPTLLLWGEDDKTFPVGLGESMARQFTPPAAFARIHEASLMPHEERPEAVLAHLLPFLGEQERSRSHDD
jgi:pimeloyl-ACP methyl ester carboxylesterase